MSKKVNWSERDIEDIKHKYLIERLSCREISLHYNVCDQTINNLIKKLNIKLAGNNCTSKTYTFNKHYFDNIDTPNKAYWLGWLYSDGCNSLKRYKISLGLQEEDKEIIEKFNLDLESTYPIKTFDGTGNRKRICKLCIYNKYLSQRLNELGVVPNKSLILKFPTENQIPRRLLRHWLRGMWDGDGSFTLYKNKYKDTFYNTLECNLGGTIFICNGIKEYLKSEIGINIGVYDVKRGNTFRHLTMGGTQHTMYFLNWLYQKEDIQLYRKQKKWSNIKNTLLQEGWIPKGKFKDCQKLSYSEEETALSG